MKNEEYILLVSPHSKCIDPIKNINHTCDTLAGKFAQTLSININKEMGMKTIYMEGDVNRTVCDLNRKDDCDAYKSSFKKKLGDYLSEKDKELPMKPRLLLDIHSFPSHIINPPRDMYFIISMNDINSVRFINKLYDYLKEHNVSVSIFKGDDNKNDIIYMAYNNNVLSALIEVNESITDDDKINHLSNTLIRGIKTILI